MYRLNSLNADIQLIVDGAWESNSGIFVSFPPKHFGIFGGFWQKHLGVFGDYASNHYT